MFKKLIRDYKENKEINEKYDRGLMQTLLRIAMNNWMILNLTYVMIC